MSARVHDSNKVEVPEASPDANEEKQNTQQDESTKPPRRRHLWIGLSAILLVVIAASIAIPLSLRKDHKEKKESVTTNASLINQAGPLPAENQPMAPFACTKELKICGDGTPVGRTGPNCEFEPCPDELPMVACTLELKICIDGSSVGRTGPNCEFEPCPDDTPTAEQLPAKAAPTDLCPPPGPDADCVTEESHRQCMDLVNAGCKMIVSTFSCPPLHRCGDQPEAEQLPAEDVAVPPAACTMELKTCSDGSSVGRTGPNCEFEPCPDEISMVACTLELKICSDGSSVGRTGPNCEFEPCPDETPTAEQLPAKAAPADLCPPPGPDADCVTEESHRQCMDLVNAGCKMMLSTFSCPPLHRCGDQPEAEQLPAEEQPMSPVACTMELKTCSDGSSVGRTGPNCEFEPCPDELPMVGCTLELAYCGNGQAVGRSGPNCHFEECDDGSCPVGTYTCDDGTELVRDPALGCEYPSCPVQEAKDAENPVMCTMDAKACPDGSFVGRVGPDCAFEPCPGEEDNEDLPAMAACTLELAYCPGGKAVGRTGPKCHFEECDGGLCPMGTYLCNDGVTELVRDPALGCEYPLSDCP